MKTHNSDELKVVLRSVIDPDNRNEIKIDTAVFELNFSPVCWEMAFENCGKMDVSTAIVCLVVCLWSHEQGVCVCMAQV